jgi:hypothetical protein
MISSSVRLSKQGQQFDKKFGVDCPPPSLDVQGIGL